MRESTDRALRRARFRSPLIEHEGVSEAEDFLFVLDVAAGEDPEFHDRLVAEIERRAAIREVQAANLRAEQARAVLSHVANARETRVGPADVRCLVGIAYRGLA